MERVLHNPMTPVCLSNAVRPISHSRRRCGVKRHVVLRLTTHGSPSSLIHQLGLKLSGAEEKVGAVTKDFLKLYDIRVMSVEQTSESNSIEINFEGGLKLYR